MSNYCVDCGSPLPDDQGSRTCSMCYGDPGHGRDGYYQRWLDEGRAEEERQEEEQRAEQERYDQERYEQRAGQENLF